MKILARLGCLFALLALLVSSSAANPLFSSLFVFGDSLSDSGNNAIALAPNVTPVPISGNTFVPTFPYASGTYSNGPVWAQSFAASLGLSANPSLAGGTNYAFGGARTGPLSPNSLPGGLLNPFPPSLETQAAYFLAQHGNVAPSDALYVLAGGGDNARDGFEALGACADLVCIAGTIASTATEYSTDVATILGELRLAGAEHFIVWNTPDIGVVPAVLATGASTLASSLASSMNVALMTAIGGVPGVTVFDIFDLVNDVVTNPGAFGLINVTDACAQSVACDPSTSLFWDGIHPTSAGQLIISEAMLDLVPEPATLALLCLGLVVLGLNRSRHAGAPRGTRLQASRPS